MKIIETKKDHITFEMHDKDAFDILYQIGKQAYLQAPAGKGYAAFATKPQYTHDEIVKGIFPDDAGFWQGPAALYLDYIGPKVVNAFVAEVAKHQTEPKKLYVFYTAKLDEIQDQGTAQEIIDKVLESYTK
ncbi:hypothetical protein KY348_02730 [Candidatus Woesearchaeota archaeon]|nr:hypothetical protein [Candidatus Woesearchaeota archaeon]